MIEIVWFDFWSTVFIGILGLAVLPWVIRGVSYLLTLLKRST